MKSQKTKNSQSNLEKNKAGTIMLPDFKLYNKAIAIKKKYGTGTKTDTQINGIEKKKSSEVNTHTVD